MNLLTEAMRKAHFSACPMTEGFLSTLMQDVQQGEDEAACGEGRDVGTIYTCPDATFNAAVHEVVAFKVAMAQCPVLCEHAETLMRYNGAQLGSDLYMERAGHGVGFQDRTLWDDDRAENDRIGAALSAAVSPRASLEPYVGDDGAVYILGQERA